MSRNPIKPFWRSAHAPVWNHHIDRPALLWDAQTGPVEETFAALLSGRGADAREAAPTSTALRQRLEDELAVCLRALRDHTRAYEERRWSPGKLTPVSDALWRSSDGYLDLLDELTPRS
jgi:hypothetical protein